MPVAYTPEQLQAINARGRDILVSAAAGSGKTAVLAERILRLLKGDGAALPLDVDKLLVVTYTDAAAAEMRERVAAKLEEHMEQDPSNNHLRRQAALLPQARISTVHAFCNRLVKEHFARIGLDPSFRIGDEAELELIQALVMDELFEEEYTQSDNRDFLELADSFGGRTRDDRLETLMRLIYAFIENNTQPEEMARAYVNFFARGADNLEETPWIGILREELAAGLTGALAAARRAMCLCRQPGGPSKYEAALKNDEAQILSLTATLEEPFGNLYGAFTQLAWTRLPTYRANDDVSPLLKDSVKAIRDKGIKERVNKLRSDIFFAAPEKMKDDIRALHSRVETLAELVLRYRDMYALEKRARGLMDFNDLEHYAIKILTGDDDNPPPVFDFREVLIDEYQDSNAVQEWILSAVAGAATRFMVGDVKQSIYRFRHANPRLFIEKYNAFQRLKGDGSAEISAPVRIDLTRNFRSRPEVLNTVNFFFSQLMTPELGEVAYDAHAALYPGADYGSPPRTDTYNTMVDLIDCANAESDDDDQAIPIPDDEDSPSKQELEARAIALRIRSLVGQPIIWDSQTGQYRPCKNNDIVILARSVTGTAKILTETLKKYGVDAVADMRAGFFDTLEIGTALSFLRVVDNPRQDIPLITVLYSPVYAFTPDELLNVREENPEGDYYDCLAAYASDASKPETSRDKTRRFLHDLEKWRDQAVHLPVSRLISLIYDETNYPAYAGAMSGGNLRQANLRLLLERAMQYEETRFKGLFHFLLYMERLSSSAGGAGSINTAQEQTADRVRVMSIHRAKGLEFPIVFVSLLGRTMNREDERRDVVFHPEYGLGPVYVDLDARTKSNTLARLGLAKLIRRESLSEELRVLYVAMTRAKELLVLTGTVSDLAARLGRWAEAASFNELTLPVYYRRECVSFLDWLMPCLARHRDCVDLFPDMESACAEIFNHPARFTVTVRTANGLRETDSLNTSAAFYSSATPAGRASSEYAHDDIFPSEAALLLVPKPYTHEAALNLPSKVSISELKRLFAPETSPDGAPLFTYEKLECDPPAFYESGRTINAPRMGTILHTVMEHIDLHNHRSRAAINGLIDELAGHNLLTPEEAAAVNRSFIERFVQSRLADRMRQARVLYREVPFVMGLSPQEVYPDSTAEDETILVHGIIDCYFEENGGIVLVDYKSDVVADSPAVWAESHRVQMGIYKKAVARATGREVREALLYSFALGDTVAIEL